MRKDIRIAYWFVIGFAIVALPAFAADSRDAWIGRWEGSYVTDYGFQSTELIVKTVDSEKGTALVVYDQGSAGKYGAFNIETKGEFSPEGKLVVKFTFTFGNNPAVVTYTITERGTLHAVLKTAYAERQAELKKK